MVPSLENPKGEIWLDKGRTSPYKFYQYWLNAADQDAENYIKIFTFLSQEEIETLIAHHQEARTYGLYKNALPKKSPFWSIPKPISKMLNVPHKYSSGNLPLKTLCSWTVLHFWMFLRGFHKPRLINRKSQPVWISYQPSLKKENF